MLILPEELREEVRKPFGAIFAGKSILEECRKSARPLIAVGDQCAYDLIKNKVYPDILVFDFKIKRVEILKEMKQEFAPHAAQAFVVLSPAGAITDELSEAVDMVLAEGKGAVFVVGEDDLSSLLVMARAKKGTLVYGQPDLGAVVVKLGGKEIMEKAQGFLGRMRQE